MKRTLFSVSLLALGAAMGHSAHAQSAADVLDTYADIAEANYADSLSAAQVLQEAINALIASPSAATMQAARAAWLEARGLSIVAATLVSCSQGRPPREAPNCAQLRHGCIGAAPLEAGPGQSV